MDIALFVSILWSTLMFALSLHLAIGNALEFYPATLPIICVSGMAASLAWFGLIFRRLQSVFVAISSLLLMTLIIPWYSALESWPGGDDGGKLGWLFLMGGASLLSMPIAGVASIVSLRRLVSGADRQSIRK
jgi:hypothetical protein